MRNTIAAHNRKKKRSNGVTGNSKGNDQPANGPMLPIPKVPKQEPTLNVHISKSQESSSTAIPGKKQSSTKRVGEWRSASSRHAKTHKNGNSKTSSIPSAASKVPVASIAIYPANSNSSSRHQKSQIQAPSVKRKRKKPVQLMMNGAQHRGFNAGGTMANALTQKALRATPTNAEVPKFQSDTAMGRFFSRKNEHYNDYSSSFAHRKVSSPGHSRHRAKQQNGFSVSGTSMADEVRGVSLSVSSLARWDKLLDGNRSYMKSNKKKAKRNLLNLDQDSKEAQVMQQHINNLLLSKDVSKPTKGSTARRRKLSARKSSSRQRRPQSALGIHRKDISLNVEGSNGNRASPHRDRAHKARPSSAAGTRTWASQFQAAKISPSGRSSPAIGPETGRGKVSRAHFSMQNYSKYLQQKRSGKSVQEVYFENLFRKRQRQKKLSETYRTGAASPTKRQRQQDRTFHTSNLLIDIPNAGMRKYPQNTGQNDEGLYHEHHTRQRPQSAMMMRPRPSSSMSTTSPEFLVEAKNSFQPPRPHSSMALRQTSYDDLDEIATTRTEHAEVASPQARQMTLEMSRTFRQTMHRRRPQSAQARNRRTQDASLSDVRNTSPSSSAMDTNASLAQQQVNKSEKQQWTQQDENTDTPRKSEEASDEIQGADGSPSSPATPPKILFEPQSSTPKHSENIVHTPNMQDATSSHDYMLTNPDTSLSGTSPSPQKIPTSHPDSLTTSVGVKMATESSPSTQDKQQTQPNDHSTAINEILNQMRGDSNESFVDACNSLLDLMKPSKSFCEAAKKNQQLVELVLSKFLDVTKEQEDQPLLIGLIKVLAQLCHNCTDNRMLFKRHFGVRKVIDLLEHIATVSANRDYFVQFMKNIFQSDFTLQMDFRLGGGIERLCANIRENLNSPNEKNQHPARVGVFIHALISVVFHNTDNLSCFMENDGVQALLSFFDSGSSLIHEYSGICLASLAKENPQLKSVLADMKAIHTYIRVCKRSPSEAIIRSCGHLCTASPKNQDLFVERKGIDLLYNLLAQWRSLEVGVLKRCLVTLSSVCKSNKMAVDYVQRTNGHRHVMNVMMGLEACRGVGALTVSVLVENQVQNQTNFSPLIAPMMSYLHSIQTVDKESSSLITNFSLCLRSLCMNHNKNMNLLRQCSNNSVLKELSERKLESNSEPQMHLSMLKNMICA